MTENQPPPVAPPSATSLDSADPMSQDAGLSDLSSSSKIRERILSLIGDTSAKTLVTGKREWIFHLIFSSMVIIFIWEFSVLIAAGFLHRFCPVPVPVSSFLGLAFSLVFSFLLEKLNPILKASGRVHQYLRSFAFASVLLPLWALSFAMNAGVIVLLAILMVAGCWGILWLRHKPDQQRLAIVVFAVWTVFLFLDYWVVGKPILTPRQIPVVQVPVQPDGTPPPESTLRPKPSVDPGISNRFFQAVRNGDLDTVRKMVESKSIDPLNAVEAGSAPMHYAAASGSVDLLRYLLSKKADINAPDVDGTTPLMIAAGKKDGAMVKFLLSRRANPDLKRDTGERAIDIARKAYSSNIVLMIKNKSKKRARATEKKTRRRGKG